MSEFLAEATVSLRADSTKFLADVQKAVTAAEKQKVNLVVRPDMTGFRAALTTALASSTRGVSVKVPVRPDMTGFRTALQGAIASSTRGVSATVAVKTGDVSKAAVASAAAAAPTAVVVGRARGAQTADEIAAEARAADKFSRQRVQGIDEQEKRLQRLARQEAAHAAAVRLETQAIKEQNVALQAEAGILRRRSVEAQQVTRGAFDKEAARRAERDPAQIAAREQAAKEQADAALKAQSTLNEKRLLAERKFLDSIADLRETTTFETQLAGVKGDESEARKRITAAVHGEREAKKLLRAAEREGLTGAVEEITKFRAEASALKVASERTLELATANSKLSTQIATARRAVVAQIANLTGLRGAALTAASGFIAVSAGIIALRKAVSLAGDLESELAVFGVTAGATAEEMEKVHERAIELGKDITLPAVSAGDAAVALTELSKAGLGVQDAIDGAKGVLQLATAANINFTQATNLAASALNAFGLSGEEASHVADVLANSANQSQGSITDAGVALQQSAAVARQAGLTLEQTVAALTLFARAGLRGSDAGTSLRTALIRLINPSEKAEGIIKQLGLRLRTASGAIDLNVFQQFTDATKDLTAAQRDQALAIIFGQDAIRGAAILAREGASGLSAQERAINKVGTASQVASARTSGYAGALENLKNQIEAVGEEVGASLLPAVTAVLNLFTDAIVGVTELIHKLQDLRAAAQKPIEVVVHTITGQEEGEDPQGFLQRLGEHVIAGVDPKEQLKLAAEDINALRAQLRSAKADAAAFAAEEGVPQIFKSLREAAKNPVDFNEAIVDLKNMVKEMEGGSKKTEEFRNNFQSFVSELQEISTLPTLEIPVALDKLKVTGIAREAGDFSAKAFTRSFTGVIENFQNTSAKEAFERALQEAFGPAADAAAARIAAQFNRSFGRAAGQAQGFERQAIEARVRNDVPAEIRALRGRERSLRRQIDAINKKTFGDPKDALLQKRTELFGDLEGVTSQIEGIERQQAADAKQKADDIKKARNEADQAILDSLAPATRRLDTRALIAQGTEGLRDDIIVANAQIKNNQHRIAVIRKSFNDRKRANELIADLRDENIKLSQQIATNTQALFDADRQAFEVKLGQAEAEDNIEKQISLTQNRIKKLNRLIAAGKAEGETLKKYRDERAERRRQIEELRDEQLQAQTDFAQSVFDLTGNKNPLLNALNAQIREAQGDVRAAKRGTTAWFRAKTEVNKLLEQRKQLFEDVAKETQQGTTAFDLLQGAAETFRATGGNIIGGNQPFAGPTGFTADLAQFLRRQQVPRLSVDTSDVPGRAIERQLAATNNLIAALDRNTAAQGGNTAANLGAPGTAYADITGKRARAMAKYYEGIEARKARENRIRI